MQRERGESIILDEQLIRKIKSGNKQALRLLIERHKQVVFKIAYSVVHDEKQAEDIAQDTFIKMIDALDSYQTQGFKTWLSRIALHKAIDYKRKMGRHKEDLKDFDQDYQLTRGISVEDEIIEKERKRKVHSSIQELPDKLRKTVQYYYIEGLSYSEIATRLDVAEKTVEMRLYRARKWMKTNWKEDDF